MAVYLMPTYPGEPWFEYLFVMDGSTYLLEFHWSDRDAAWFLNVYDTAENLLLAGRKLVIGGAVFSRFQNDTLPPGEIVLLDTTGSQTDATLNDFGTRVLPFYWEAADLAALA